MTRQSNEQCYNIVTSRLWSLVGGEEGGSAVEYGLVAALVAVAIIGALGSLGTAVQGLFENVKDQVVAALGG